MALLIISTFVFVAFAIGALILQAGQLVGSMRGRFYVVGHFQKSGRIEVRRRGAEESGVPVVELTGIASMKDSSDGQMTVVDALALADLLDEVARRADPR